MGFSIWVADDPELADLEALENDEEETKDSGYPSFSITNRGMVALVREMDSQGMGEFMPLAAFNFCDGNHITAGQISAALSVAGQLPVTASDEEMVEIWRSWIAFLRTAVSHDGIVIN
jgi:hypothetical protein